MVQTYNPRRAWWCLRHRTHTSLTRGPVRNKTRLGIFRQSSAPHDPTPMPPPLVASIQRLHVLEASVCPHQTHGRLSPRLPCRTCFHACFHMRPLELPHACFRMRPSRAHSKQFELSFGGSASPPPGATRLRRAFPHDSRIRPHATCAPELRG